MKWMKRALCSMGAVLCLLAFPGNAYGAVEIYEDNAVYYQLADGSIGNEHWEKRGDDWYYVGAMGNVIRDNVILAYDNAYYVFDEKGRMLRSQTVFKNGLSYVISESGAAWPEETEEEQLLKEYAASLVAEITNDSMTIEEKCDAVFQNLWTDYAYDQTNETDGNIVESAMKAFDLKRGNCYVLMAKAHYMYQAIGIKDMVVVCPNESGKPVHWWNLLKIGDQYCHVDKTPFSGFPGWNLVNTEELMETSKSDEMVKLLHQFNQENYPKAY